MAITIRLSAEDYRRAVEHARNNGFDSLSAAGRHIWMDALKGNADHARLNLEVSLATDRFVFETFAAWVGDGLTAEVLKDAHEAAHGQRDILYAQFMAEVARRKAMAVEICSDDGEDDVCADEDVEDETEEE